MTFFAIIQGTAARLANNEGLTLSKLTPAHQLAFIEKACEEMQWPFEDVKTLMEIQNILGEEFGVEWRMSPEIHMTDKSISDADAMKIPYAYKSPAGWQIPTKMKADQVVIKYKGDEVGKGNTLTLAWWDCKQNFINKRFAVNG